MPGPAPAEQRRRRNEPARGEWVDLPTLERPVLPELPQLVDEEWHPDVRKLWEAWRSDPVSAKWSPADRAYALETIMLRQAARGNWPAEVRLRMDALGLTPKGKRDLRWRISDIAAEPQKQPRSSARKRAHLTAV